MSSDKEGPTDDDGWGEAADSAEDIPESKEPPDAADGWDSTKLEERVAALSQERDLPTSESGPIDLEDGDAEQEAVKPTETAPTYVEVSVPVPTDPGEGEVDIGSVGSISQVVEVVDEDAPHWSGDELELPAPSSDMAAAAGVLATKAEDPKAEKRRKRRERHPRTQLTRRQQMFLLLGSGALVIVSVCAILGYFNSQNYYLVCRTKSISAEQGSFWPWGQGNLAGPAFRPIAVPSDVLCTNQKFESRKVLELAFLEVLLQQSTSLLTSPDSDGVQNAEQQLAQALLLTRDPARSAQRGQAERLQGDILYSRGAAEMQRAMEALQLSAERFDEAAARRPRHSSDANARADHARLIQEELSKGPHALRPISDAGPVTSDPATGLMDAPSFAPNTDPPDPEFDAGLEMPDAEPLAAPPEIDAGLPKGGVLL